MTGAGVICLKRDIAAAMAFKLSVSRTTTKQKFEVTETLSNDAAI